MRRLGLGIAAAGVAVWAFGVVAWVLGVWVTMPPEVVRALVLSLAAVTGAGLLVLGAVVARTAGGRAGGRRARAASPPPPIAAPPEPPQSSPRRGTPAVSHERATERVVAADVAAQASMAGRAPRGPLRS